MSISQKILFRFKVIFILMFIPVIGIVFSLIKIQATEGETWIRTKNRILSYAIYSNDNKKDLRGRGTIISSDDQLIAGSKHQFRFSIDLQASPKFDSLVHAGIDRYSIALAEVLPQYSVQYFKERLKKGLTARNNRDFLIAQGLSFDMREALKTAQEPLRDLRRAFKFMPTEIRCYPFGRLGVRTIGVHNGSGAASGLEKGCDSILASGKNIRSTMDMRMQELVYSSLYNKVCEVDALEGVAVLMEVKTGEVKAMVNLTRLDSGRYVEKYNNALKDQYEPGSTFKTISMMVALENDKVEPHTVIHTGNGVLDLHGKLLRDHNWRKGGYGDITAEEVMYYSSNIGIAKVIEQAYGSNPSAFVESIYRMQIHQNLYLDIPGSSVPIIPHPKNKSSERAMYWDKLRLSRTSIGYSTQLPPIYTLNFYNAIANNGKLIKPIFYNAIYDNGVLIEGRKTEVVNPSICSKKTLQQIRKMLEGVLTHGTGKGFASTLVQIAGKTGTAQMLGRKGDRSFGVVGHRVSFCGYFPANDPKYSCIVVLTKPSNGYPSGGMPGSVFRDIAEQVYALGKNIQGKGTQIPVQNSILPPVSAGKKNDTKLVLSYLGITHQEQIGTSKAEWVETVSDSTKVMVSSSDRFDYAIPDVYGMGAKDAIYLLESKGYSVKIKGRGTVVSQSITAADSIAALTIVLTLEPKTNRHETI